MKTNRSDTYFYQNHTNGINCTVTGRGSWGGGQEFAAELEIPTRRSIANKAMCNVEILTLKQHSAINKWANLLQLPAWRHFFNFHLRTYVRSYAIVTHFLWTVSLPFINTSSEVVKCQETALLPHHSLDINILKLSVTSHIFRWRKLCNINIWFINE